MDAEAYRLNTLWTATRVLDGGSVGAEASANKIHWSETDLAIHRAALDLLGPEAELTGTAWTLRGWTAILFALAGPIYAGTNEIQRNVVAERMLGLPRGLGQPRLHFAFTDQQLEFRDAVRQVLAKECTTDDVRAAFEAPSARSARWTTLADLGVVGLAVPEAHGGLGLGMVDLVPLVEEAGRVACPSRWSRPPAWPHPCSPTWQRATGTVARLGPWLALTGRRRPSPWPSPTPGTRHCPCRERSGPTCCAVAAGRTGPELHGLDAGTVAVTPVSSLDPTRRLGTPMWSPHRTPCWHRGRGPAGIGRDRRPGGRGRRRRAARAGRPDDQQPPTTPRTATSSASPSAASRRSSTCWPVRRCCSSSPGRWSTRAAWALDAGAGRRLAGGIGGQGLRLGRRRRGRPGRPPGPRRHRLHLGVRPPPLPQADLGPGRGVGVGLRPPRPVLGALARRPLTRRPLDRMASFRSPRLRPSGSSPLPARDGRRRRPASRCTGIDWRRQIRAVDDDGQAPLAPDRRPLRR